MISTTKCDGKGVVVAVLDTGVDPGAAGLTTTTDGKRKIVDLVDCTGAGDVDMTTHITLDPNQTTIVALSGRTLRISKAIRDQNPTRQYHLGVKHSSLLFPSSLASRFNEKRALARERASRKAVNIIREKLAQLSIESDSDKTQKQSEIDELNARIKVLSDSPKNYPDPGALFDCIVFHDGEMWRAVVDTTDDGNLEKCPILEDYVVNGSYAEFGHGLMLNFAVNIYNDGDLLSIVVDCGTHGTHVAGILAANFPDAPHLNGMAPGAQIVSLKIGDARLQSMETQQSSIRAFAYLLNHSSYDDNSDEDEVEEIIMKENDEKDTDGVNSRDTTTDSDNTDLEQSEDKIEKPEGRETVSQNGAEDDTKNQSDSMSDEKTSGNLKKPTSGKKKRYRPRIDLANMSFGEYSRDVNNGRFVRLVETLVNKHNVLFVSSAGNEGPGLSSVSAPGGTTEAIIGVGAYVTPSMVREAYSQMEFESDTEDSLKETNGTSVCETNDAHQNSSITPRSTANGDYHEETQEREPVVGMPYTWCSRGPIHDGGLGATICAPGGAIAPVPVWSLQKKMLMNGTSMSSPSAAGAIAVILSALKQAEIPYTSSLVRRAIENTARPLKQQGLSSQLGEKGKDLNTTMKMKSNKGYDGDLVFASGYGSIDALAGFRYIENYMRSRKVKNDSVKIRSESDLHANQEQLTANDINLLKINQDKQDIQRKRYRTALDSDGDMSLFIEDWRIRVRVRKEARGNSVTDKNAPGILRATRGIYLRGESETSSIQKAQAAVSVIPSDFHCTKSKRVLQQMEIHLKLVPTADWVETPKSIVLLNTQKTFPILVNPAKLVPGQAHFAEVLAYVDRREHQKVVGGPVFRVPISVLKPEPLIDDLIIKPLENVLFSPGYVLRRFYQTPFGATNGLLRITTGSVPFPIDNLTTKAESSSYHEIEFSPASSHLSSRQDVPEHSIITERPSLISTPDATRIVLNEKLTETSSIQDQGISTIEKKGIATYSASTQGTRDFGDSRDFEVHLVRVLPQAHCGDTESRHNFQLRPGVTRESGFSTNGGNTLEVCIAQLWSSAGQTLIKKVELIFGGVTPSPSALFTFSSALAFPRIEVARLLPNITPRTQTARDVFTCNVRAKLTSLNRTIAPSKHEIVPLKGERDKLPENVMIHQLVLHYSFEVFDSTSNIKISFPGISGTVYEAEVEGGPYVMVFNKRKEFLYCSDIYPTRRTLPRGQYFIRAYLRHDNVQVLSDLSNTKTNIYYAISSISLDAYESMHAASLGLSERRVHREIGYLESGERRGFYFTVPKKNSIPKWAKYGDILLGRVTFDRVESGVYAHGNEPSYIISIAVEALASGSENRAKSNSDSHVEEEISSDENKTDTEKKGKEESNDEQKDTEQDQNSLKVTDKGEDEDNAENDNGTNGPDQATPEDFKDKWIEDAIRKVKIKRLQSLAKNRKLDAFDRLIGTEDANFLQDIDVQRVILERVDIELWGEYSSNGWTSNTMNLAHEVVTAANSVISIANPNAVAAHFGILLNSESADAQRERANFEKKKTYICEAALRKLRALCAASLDGPLSVKKSTDHEKISSAVDSAAHDLAKWVCLDGSGSMHSKGDRGVATVTSEDLALTAARREIVRNRPGMALRILEMFHGTPQNRYGFVVDNVAKDMVELRKVLFASLGWHFLAKNQLLTKAVRFPKNPEPF